MVGEHFTIISDGRNEVVDTWGHHIMLRSIILRPGGSCGLVRASFSATRLCWSRSKDVLIYKGNPTVMLWNQSETDTPRREKFGRRHAAARAHPPRPVRPPRSGRAQSKRHLSSRNDRFIAREAIYKGISFIFWKLTFYFVLLFLCFFSPKSHL